MSEREPKSAALLEIRALEAAERERIAAGNSPRVFYHPGYSANGHLAGADFQPHGVPEGFVLDVEAWEAAGRTGPAPLKPAEPAESPFTEPIAVEVSEPLDLEPGPEPAPKNRPSRRRMPNASRLTQGDTNDG